MAQSLSVVIAARNCADRIEGTVMPWKSIASEIIVADQMSKDNTAEVAKLLGCQVFQNDPPGGNFDLNRKLAMQQAQCDWILYIDTDERPTSELLAEIKTFLTENKDESIQGIKIPNQFYFLGKPLKHGLYNPRSAEIRMMKKDHWHYPCEEGYHRGVSVKGKVIRFKNSYKHFNVNSLSEWFIKTNQYTELDAEKFSKNSNSQVVTYGAFWQAFRFFFRHYIIKLGFLDGFHGLVSVFYFMLYHLTLKVKTWEKVELRKLKKEEDYLTPFEIPRR